MIKALICIHHPKRGGAPEPATVERSSAAERARPARISRPVRGAFVLPALICLSIGSGPAASRQQAYTAKNPHGPIKIGCEDCHTVTSWSPIRPNPDFDHGKTAYPMRGMHKAVNCRQCHVSLVFANAGRRCADCHADIHHRQLNADCAQCHSVLGWRLSLRTVNSHQNRFPLLGAHAAVDCAACHTSAAVGQFRGLDTACVSCHRSALQHAKDPDHLALQFSSNCEACHGMDSWLRTRFDHNALTRFPLTGVHARTPCNSCHAGGRFSGTPTACFACHAADYNSTANPNHAAAGFPNTCQNCHSTASWSGATFNHTFFPMNHDGARLCGDCHPNVKDFKLFLCTNCHAQAATNSRHTGIGGYVYNSINCYQCHPTGRGGL